MAPRKKGPTKREIAKELTDHRESQAMRQVFEKRQNDRSSAKALAMRTDYRPAPMPSDAEIDAVLSQIRRRPA